MSTIAFQTAKKENSFSGNSSSNLKKVCSKLNVVDSRGYKKKKGTQDCR